MTDFEGFLAATLPRPEVDAAFAAELLAAIFGRGRVPLVAVDGVDFPDRRRIYYVSGAVVGAAALAIGAALGWKVKSQREQGAA